MSVNARGVMRRSKKSDAGGRDDVSELMRWQGTTPDGHALLVERNGGGQWIVTVASVSRSRNDSLEAALVEAGGGSVPRTWAERVAKVIRAHVARGDVTSVPAANGSRTGAA
jgi:hypothetical protein